MKKISSRIMASQKSGTATPRVEMKRQNLSSNLPFRTAAHTPRGRATDQGEQHSESHHLEGRRQPGAHVLGDREPGADRIAKVST